MWFLLKSRDFLFQLIWETMFSIVSSFYSFYMFQSIVRQTVRYFYIKLFSEVSSQQQQHFLHSCRRRFEDGPSSFESRSQPTLKFIHTEFDYCHLWMKAEEKFYGLFIKLPHIKTEKAKLELLIDSTLLFILILGKYASLIFKIDSLYFIISIERPLTTFTKF